MASDNPVITALPGNGWRYALDNDEDGGAVRLVVCFLVHADGSVVAIGLDPSRGLRPVTDIEDFKELLEP